MQMRRIFIFSAALVLAGLFTAPAFAATVTLRYGSSGAAVTTLQNELISAGYLAAGNNNGNFGPLTLAAVKKFQCAKSIVCSGTSYGLAGPMTQAALQLYAIPVQPATVGGTSLTGPATGKFEFSGWVPYWNSGTSTKDALAHLSQLTSIMPFGYTMTTDGTLVDTAHLGSEPFASLIAAAKAQKVRVVPTVMWGNGAAIQNVLSNQASRVALEVQIVNAVKQNNFDGIDIDFEAKQADTVNFFSVFLKELYARMGNKFVYCTVEARQPLEDRYSPGATIPPDATQYANDYGAMNKYCDRVEIMAYDQGTIDVRLNDARSAPYAPVADPGWVSDLVTLAAQSISKNKLIIGVPTYGYEYQVTPVASGFQYKVLWALTPRYAMSVASQLGITPTRTSANELGFTYNANALQAVAPTDGDSTQTQQSAPQGGVAQNLGSQVNGTQPFNYITWSDAQAIADKVALAHKLGLRGVAVFSFGGEDPNMWGVLK